METIIDTTTNSATEYDGPIPEGSYLDLGLPFLMASPEFLFLRKAIMLPTPHAVAAGLDLLCPYHNHTTTRDFPEGLYEYRGEPHTTIDAMRHYVGGIDANEYPREYRKALKVIDLCEAQLDDFLSELAFEF